MTERELERFRRDLEELRTDLQKLGQEIHDHLAAEFSTEVERPSRPVECSDG
jgi:hypothetical protein